MRRAAETTRAGSTPAVPVTVAAGGEAVIAADPHAPPVRQERVQPPPAKQQPAPFTIQIPEDWAGGEVFGFDDDAARSFVYSDGYGRTFSVNLDPMGAGFNADEVWRYRVRRGDRFSVAGTTTCHQGEPMCDKGNGSFLGYAVWIEGGSATVGAHSYYFRFTDTNGENESTDIFRGILQSIRVHV